MNETLSKAFMAVTLLLLAGFVAYFSFFSDSPAKKASPEKRILEEVQQANADVRPDETKPTKTIVALWDSLTAWYELMPEESYPAQLEVKLRDAGYSYRVVNGGISGDTTLNLLSRYQALLEESKPDFVILEIGGNDGLRRLPLDGMEKNIREILAYLDQKNIPVVFAGMKIPKNFGAYSDEFAEVFPKIAKDAPMKAFYPFFLEWVALQDDLLIADGIHPNAKGYAKIVDQLYPFLLEKWLLAR